MKCGSVRPRYIAINFLLLVSIVCSCKYSFAEEECLSEREKCLIKRIEELERKVKELEELVKKGNRIEDMTVSSNEKEVPNKSLEDVKKEEERDSKELEIVQTLSNSKAPKLSEELKPLWKDKLTFRNEDGTFEIQIGGRIQLDWAFFDNDSELESVFGEEEDGVQFRRARIDFSGKIYENIRYRMEFDFAGDKDSGGRGKFTDVYVTLLDLPYLGNLQLGHFREPFGLERLTNNNYLTFIERGLNDTFTPKRNVGIMAFNNSFSDRLIWQVGVFKETDDFPSDDDTDEDQGYSFTGRAIYLPLWKENGKKLLHLGLAYSYRDPNGASFRYRTQPECALAYTYLDTDKYEGFRLGSDAVVDDVDLIGTEFLLIYGPWSIQGEYMNSIVDTMFGGTRNFSGGYIYTSYFLTGDSRNYDQKMGVLSRVKPLANLSPKAGQWGAWELGLRFSWIDLDSGIIRGGKEQNWTVGLNWYLNPNTRLMLNYTRADIHHDLYDGVLGIFQTRLQIDF